MPAGKQIQGIEIGREPVTRKCLQRTRRPAERALLFLSCSACPCIEERSPIGLARGLWSARWLQNDHTQKKSGKRGEESHALGIVVGVSDRPHRGAHTGPRGSDGRIANAMFKARSTSRDPTAARIQQDRLMSANHNRFGRPAVKLRPTGHAFYPEWLHDQAAAATKIVAIIARRVLRGRSASLCDSTEWTPMTPSSMSPYASAAGLHFDQC